MKEKKGVRGFAVLVEEKGVKFQVPSQVSPGVKINAKSGRLSTRRRRLPLELCVSVVRAYREREKLHSVGEENP